MTEHIRIAIEKALEGAKADQQEQMEQFRNMSSMM